MCRTSMHQLEKCPHLTQNQLQTDFKWHQNWYEEKTNLNTYQPGDQVWYISQTTNATSGTLFCSQGIEVYGLSNPDVQFRNYQSGTPQ